MSVCCTCLCILVIIIITGVDTRSRNYCDYASSIDCRQRPQSDNCGSDGNSYYNMCALALAQCSDSSLYSVHRGNCTQSTASPSTTTTTEDGAMLAYDIFCLDLFLITCPQERSREICASNSATYSNLCEFDKARCTHRDLRIVKYGAC